MSNDLSAELRRTIENAKAIARRFLCFIEAGRHGTLCESRLDSMQAMVEEFEADPSAPLGPIATALERLDVLDDRMVAIEAKHGEEVAAIERAEKEEQRVIDAHLASRARCTGAADGAATKHDEGLELMRLLAAAADCDGTDEEPRPGEYYVDWLTRAARRIAAGTLAGDDLRRLVEALGRFRDLRKAENAARAESKRIEGEVVVAEKVVGALLSEGAA